MSEFSSDKDKLPSDLLGNKSSNSVSGRSSIIGELFGYLWKRKLFWMIPMVIVVVIFAIIIILGSNPITAPFIYSVT